MKAIQTHEVFYPRPGNRHFHHLMEDGSVIIETRNAVFFGGAGAERHSFADGRWEHEILDGNELEEFLK